MTRKKQYLVVAVIAIVAVLADTLYNYVYRDHRNIATEKVDFEFSAHELQLALADENEASKYVDKVVMTYGTVTAIEQQSIVIDDRVQVSFIEGISADLAIDNKISIKGRCVGYDDLLELVKIDQATLLAK
ncbi:MAG: hypothetical protein CMH48_01420 [Muricauda sp.]|uniref:tRNA_anti-like n=1 Tax=Flagellimonas lutaonensis TaxID=516051 RepID=A0A0D5YX72_9FLAO|nr:MULTISPECIES: hypothetical protein [Allomuricauda]AKA36506.1 hypothetical protein VC82_2962 [Allomuricauda lutaonensis]MBC29482.1 hypothetical protein [Allomuricauda sp.]|tara:strand:- start:605 stop:997 length:393 start_codon:yes stop_codon:yes gene_type:complete